MVCSVFGTARQSDLYYLVEKQNKENFEIFFVDSEIVKTCDELDLGLGLPISIGGGLQIGKNNICINNLVKSQVS